MKFDHVLQGPLTLTTVPNHLPFAKTWSTSSADVHVDLSAVEAVDSSALSLLLEWSRSAQAQGKMCTFHHPSPALLALAHLYGVAEVLRWPVQPSA
ncbi:STAS domain-containing protein [Parvibium lacunae]|uniref:STAS domain-containing protein n=1 Tax=Parvibium lacunae TaxID=1888893 RepID=A0A368L1P2_9BURK|nr:STAS domain-containing protein [Parvibium lacunae]RCS57486.1 STAS domain-containing protein [Parvibium lacunae]